MCFHCNIGLASFLELNFSPKSCFWDDLVILDKICIMAKVIDHHIPYHILSLNYSNDISELSSVSVIVICCNVNACYPKLYRVCWLLMFLSFELGISCVWPLGDRNNHVV